MLRNHARTLGLTGLCALLGAVACAEDTEPAGANNDGNGPVVIAPDLGAGAAGTTAAPTGPTNNPPTQPPLNTAGTTGNPMAGAAGSAPDTTDPVGAAGAAGNDTMPDTGNDTAPMGNPDAEPEVPITADGWFGADSNFYGFTGSWYCYDDSAATGNTTSCVTDEPPLRDGKMCLSGTTTVRDMGDYTNWGAAIEVALQDDGGTKKPYDAAAAGIKGFSFTIEGDTGGAVLEFQIPREASAEDAPPSTVVSTAGDYTVDFGDLMSASWDTIEPGAGPNPDSLYIMVWKVKGGESASSYDFCVTNVKAY